MSGAGFAGALTAGDEYGRDAEVEALAEALRQDSVRRIWLDESDAAGLARAILAAGYTRRPADWCHNGHPFRPGTTIDNDPPSDDWCDVCGEARRPAPGGVPVEALRELADEWDEAADKWPYAVWYDNQKALVRHLRALLPTATTDGGES